MQDDKNDKKVEDDNVDKWGFAGYKYSNIKDVNGANEDEYGQP